MQLHHLIRNKKPWWVRIKEIFSRDNFYEMKFVEKNAELSKFSSQSWLHS